MSDRLPAGVTDLIYPRRYYITQQPPPIQVVGGGASEKGEIEDSDWLGGCGARDQVACHWLRGAR